MRASAVRRGCGSRKEGGVYIECGLSPGGSPIENFLFDPPLTIGSGIPAEWLMPHRAPILFERDGAWHVVIWVGSDAYPSIWDYIEEVRVAGSSRRVSTTFDFSKLGPFSRQYFVHEEGANDVDAIVSTLCPIRVPARVSPSTGPEALHPLDGPGVKCIGFTKYLPAPTPGEYREVIEADGTRTRTLPCGRSYTLFPPPDTTMVAEPAVFLQLPITGVAMVNKGDGSFPQPTEERVRKANVETFRADE